MNSCSAHKCNSMLPCQLDFHQYAQLFTDTFQHDSLRYVQLLIRFCIPFAYSSSFAAPHSCSSTLVLFHTAVMHSRSVDATLCAICEVISYIYKYIYTYLHWYTIINLQLPPVQWQGSVAKISHSVTARAFRIRCWADSGQCKV